MADLETKYPVINLKLNGANHRLIGDAFETVASELNNDKQLVGSIQRKELHPTCVVYIYPNAKRLIFQQRLLSSMIRAQRNNKAVYYVANRFWHMREACKKGMLEKWLRIFEAFTFPPRDIPRPKTFIFPEEVGKFNREEKLLDSAGVTSQCPYIIKPDDGACGRDIDIALNRHECIKIALEKNAVNKSQQEGIIVQRYIEKPLTYNNKKFDLRIYLLITNVRNNNVQYHFDRSLCFARVASSKYSFPNKLNQGEAQIHLTNTTLSEHKEDSKIDINEVFETIVEQQLNGTYGVGDDVEYWVCQSKKCKHKNRYSAKDTTICVSCKKPNPDVYSENEVLDIEAQWENIENLIFATMQSISPILALHYHSLFGLFENPVEGHKRNNASVDQIKKEKTNSHCFQVLGFDVMCTQKKAFLIEVNANASFALETQLDEQVKLQTIREAFLSKTMPNYQGAEAFQDVHPSFHHSERFLHECFIVYSKLSSQQLKKPTSELPPLSRKLNKQIVQMILEKFEDALPQKCVDDIQQKKIFQPPLSFFVFVSGLKQISSTFVSRESGMEVLKSILAELVGLHDRMTQGMVKNGFTIARPLALGVTELGWVERNRDKQLSPRKKSPRTKGLTNEFMSKQIL